MKSGAAIAMLKAMENETVCRGELGAKSQTFGFPDGHCRPCGSVRLCVA